MTKKVQHFASHTVVLSPLSSGELVRAHSQEWICQGQTESTGVYAPVKEFCSYTNFGHNDGVTAIASVYTRDGFVIGADGRRVDKLADGSVNVETESARKIFSFQDNNIHLAYAWTGLTSGSGKNGLVFNLPDISQRLLSSRKSRSEQDFNSFLSTFCNQVCARLAETPFSRGPVQSDPEVARAIFVGFFNGEPCTAAICVREVAGIVFVPVQSVHIPAQFHKSVFAGGEKVYEAFKNLSPRCESEAIDFVKEYIQACAVSSDEDCVGIGGHIHVASITPADGFQWAIPPLDQP